MGLTHLAAASALLLNFLGYSLGNSFAGEYTGTIAAGGAAGYFTMLINNNGKGSYNWNLDLNNFDLPSAAQAAGCTMSQIISNGLKYHIHSYWNSTFSGGSSSTKCGGLNTGCGGHYDPYLACSKDSQSSTTLCTKIDRTAALGYTYNCSSAHYAQGHLSYCEAGDISGKFGFMKPQSSSNLVFSGSITDDPNPPIAANYMRSDGVSLQWASVVFHCPLGNSSRILCAQMVQQSSYDGSGDDDANNSGSNINGKAWRIVGIVFIILFLLLSTVAAYLFVKSKSSTDSLMQNQMSNAKL